MNIEKKVEGSKIQLSPEGFIDTANAPDFEAAMDAAVEQAKNLIVDFEKVEYISSSGLRILLKTQKKLFAENGIMVIRNLAAPVKEVFELTGFLDILTVE